MEPTSTRASPSDEEEDEELRRAVGEEYVSLCFFCTGPSCQALMRRFSARCDHQQCERRTLWNARNRCQRALAIGMHSAEGDGSKHSAAIDKNRKLSRVAVLGQQCNYYFRACTPAASQGMACSRQPRRREGQRLGEARQCFIAAVCLTIECWRKALEANPISGSKQWSRSRPCQARTGPQQGSMERQPPLFLS